MFKKIRSIVFLTITCFSIIMPIKVSANNYTLNDLVEKGKALDGRKIIVEGEAIGEVICRDYYSWININDTTNAMGIYMTKDDSLKVENYGGYNTRGDVLKVVGTFNRACKEHGGDMDIHAQSVDVIKEGSVKKYNIPKEKIFLAILMPILTLIIGYLLYRRNSRK